MLAAIEDQATKRFMMMLAPSKDSGKHTEMLRLGMGRLMALLVGRMTAAATTDSAVKMYLYSGHDSTILPLYSALGKTVREGNSLAHRSNTSHAACCRLTY
jgi:hypothetical protein